MISGLGMRFIVYCKLQTKVRLVVVLRAVHQSQRSLPFFMHFVLQVVRDVVQQPHSQAPPAPEWKHCFACAESLRPRVVLESLGARLVWRSWNKAIAGGVGTWLDKYLRPCVP